MNEIYEFEGEEFEVASHRLEEFLAQYPGATKIEGPGKTIDSPEQTKIPAESQEGMGSNPESILSESQYSTPSNVLGLNISKDDPNTGQNFFNKKEEEGVKELRDLYPNFIFEEKLLGEGGGLDAITVYTRNPDGSRGDKSTSFDMNIGGMNTYGGGQYLSEEEGRNKSFDILTKFIAENSTQENQDAQTAAKNERAKLRTETNALRDKLAKPEVDLVEASFTSGTLFEIQETKVPAFAGYGKDALIGNPIPEYTKTTQPHEKELKQAREELTKSLDGKKPTEQQIKLRAKEIIINNIQNEKLTEIIEADNYQYNFSMKFGGGDKKDDATKAQKYDLAVKEFEIDFKKDLEILTLKEQELETGDEVTRLKDINNIIESETLKFNFLEGDIPVQLKNGKVIPQRVLNEYIKLNGKVNNKANAINKLAVGIQEKAAEYEDNVAAMDISRRNYNGVEEFIVETSLGTGELLMNTSAGINMFFGGENKSLIKDVTTIKKKAQEIRDSYSKDVEFDDAFKSLGNFASFAMQETSNQIPIFAALAIPGGQAAIGFGAFGDQYVNLANERETEEGRKKSNANIWWSSVGFGASELVFESLTTLPLIRAAKRGFTATPGKKTLFDMTSKKYMEKNIGKLTYGTLSEPVAEGMTQITQNFIDGRPITENLDHAMFSGLMFGTTLSAAPFARGLYLSKFNDHVAMDGVRKRVKEIKQVHNTNKNLQTKIDILLKRGSTNQDVGSIEKAQADIKNNEKIIADLQAENVAEMKEIETNLKGTSNDALKAYFKLDEYQEGIKIEAQEVVDNNSLTKQQKTDRLKALQSKFDFVQDRKNQFRDKDAFGDEYTAFSALDVNKDEVIKIEKQAKADLASKNKKNPTKIELFDQAKIIYNTNKINAEHAANQRRGLNDVINAQTKEDAVKKVENLVNVTDANKKAAIDGINNGNHGVNIPTTDNKNIPLQVVESMAADDRLETRTHEVGHSVFIKAISKDSKAFDGLANEVLSYLKTSNPSAYKRVKFRLGEQTDADEVVMLFLEEVAAGKVNVKKSEKAGFFATLMNKGIESVGGKPVDLRGETDAINFLVGVAKKIKDGTINTQDIRAIKGNVIAKQARDLVAKQKFFTDRVKASKSNLQSMLNDDYGGNVRKMGRDAISVDTRGNRLQGKQAFNLMNSRLGQDIGPMVTDITKRLYDPIIDKGGLTRQEYQNALIGVASEIIRTENFDPTVQNLDKFVSSRLYLRANALAKNLGVPQEFLKNIDDIQEPTTDSDEDVDIVIEEARTLSDYDINIDDGLVDAEIEAEIDALIEQNPKDLQKRFDDLVLKHIRKKLDNVIGKIAKNKTTGIVGPTAEYEAFIREEFDEIVASLDIETIRSAYKPWFKQEKTGRKDYKNVNEETGKVSNYRKDTFINTASKPDFIKFFTQGKPGVLRERRTALIRRIARAKAEKAVDNYIKRKSNDAGAIVNAEIRSLSRVAKNVENEQKSFDVVKFTTAVKVDFDDILSKTKREFPNAPPGKQGKYIGYINPHNNQRQDFLDQGRIWEQAYANYFIKMNLPGLQVLSEMASEEGGMADFVFKYGKDIENHELKAGLIGPWMGSVSISSYDYKSGAITLTKNIHNNLITKEIQEEVKKAHKERIDILNKGIDELNQKGGNFDYLTPDIIKGKPQYAPYELFNNFKKVLTSVESDEKPIINQYTKSKKEAVNSISFIDTKKGNISLRLSENSLLDLPMIKAKSLINFTYRNPGGKMINGNKMRAVSMGIQFKLTELLNKDSEIVDITREGDLRNALPATPSFSKQPGVDNLIKASKAAKVTNKYHNSPRGMSTFDFDETLIIDGENFIVAKNPLTNEEVKISSGNWPLQGPRYAEQGYEFDFSDFVNVRGGVDGPLLQKMKNQINKFGPENVFVLTARPQSSASAIDGWLKSKGINIPFENITGLGNSTGDAKAVWMLEKFAEGYNDMYFVDDALPNVEAVKNALEQLDIKSNVQQAKVKFSESIDTDFNNILEDVTGIGAKKRFSNIKARKRGADKGKFRFFIPPSHEDFVGLLYNFMGKGREGDGHRDFFEQSLIRPLNRAYREIDTAKQAIANDYRTLNKKFPDVNKMLTQNTPDGDFTYQDAIRVYLWNKHGYDIPGLSPTDQQNLVDIVVDDGDLRTYAENLNVISKQEKYVDPGQSWETGNVRIDLVDATGRVGRADYFAEFNENAETIFSPENLNKIEAGYGKDFRSALEDMLHRIKTGVNRPKGASARPNMFMNWLNASVSGVMFFNTRSALLQQMSNVNYLNFADNNIFAAGKAFANQPQYWDDFAMIFNSDMLKQRRGGLQTDINGAELAEAIKKARPGNMFDQVAIITGKALRLGFLPTQIGDNIAIATGGAAFYRNRVNKYIKDGLTAKDAEKAAFTDFQNITQSTQQSARPDMTSQQQASWIGKIVLNFLNTPSQYNRIIKKAGSDIINRRITSPNTSQTQSDMSNMSRIMYYGAAQNLIFYGLQTALFSVMFGSEGEDEEKKAEQILKKKERVINGAMDTILRGSGIYGVAVSTLKNMMIKFLEQRDKGYNKDESAVIMELLNFSPVVGIKARKIVNAEKTLNYNKKIIDEMETFDIDNPQWSAVTNYVEATTNVPVNRLYNKSINLRNAMDNDYTAFQRAMFFSGYTTWSLNLGDTKKMQEIKERVKGKKKPKKKTKAQVQFEEEMNYLYKSN